MDERQHKAIIKETFDTVSEGYDNPALRFFSSCASLLADGLGLKGDERVLDVATGTGNAAFLLAERLHRGQVVGVDLSPGMLERARRKASAGGIRNVEFLERDMQELGFPPASFDAAVCNFGIFFVNAMEDALAHMAATVRPGGRIAITGFQENYFHPLKDLMVKRLADLGIQMPPPAWKRVSTEAGCRELFDRAGLRDTRVELRNVGYFLSHAGEWWDVVWNAGFRRLVSQLSPEQQIRFKAEHLEEVAALATDEGIWLDVGVVIAIGKKA